MSTVRLNITLPEDLVRKLNDFVAPRRRSRFIAEAIERRIKSLEEVALRKQMEAGYKTRKDEGLQITREFEPVDVEGWD